MSITELYKKEREYERRVFGDYKDAPSLSLASFIIFLEEYVKKTKEAYARKWSRDLPPWLKTCREHQNGGYAPVKAYEELVKVMALAGAALESFTVIDPEKWRENPEYDALKWKD